MFGDNSGRKICLENKDKNSKKLSVAKQKFDLNCNLVQQKFCKSIKLIKTTS